MSASPQSSTSQVAALSLNDYHIGLVFALPKELAAGKAMLDEEHKMIQGQDLQDSNSYTLGRMHEHKVVLACLPASVDGATAAATVAVNMARTFQNIRFALLVGIGGGIPTSKHDIRLGDIVVSEPQGSSGGVVQYTKGKVRPEGFERKGTLNMPPTALLTALASLKADHELRESRISGYLSDMIDRYPRMKRNGYVYQGTDQDVLFCSSASDEDEDCSLCENGKITRPFRDSHQPDIHYGIIASGDLVIKDAAARNYLSKEYGALCVEMEAAGLMNNFPCLVIRGICDYADSHKDDEWHRCAAANAAAFAKELLWYVSPDMANNEKPIEEVMGILTDQLETTQHHADLTSAILEETRQQNRTNAGRYDVTKWLACHRAFKVSSYEADKNRNPQRDPATCSWALQHVNFQRWQHSTGDDLLWISADPGCGKSVLVRSLVDNEFRGTKSHAVCYFFFKDTDQQDKLHLALCAILHQLFDAHFKLIGYAIPAWEKNDEQLQFETAQLWRILINAATDTAIGDITCIFDGLDECRENDQAELIRYLCQFYMEARSGNPAQRPVRRGRLKFLVTSRPYGTISRHFRLLPSDLPTVRLRGEVENDTLRKEIDLVIRKQVSELAKELYLDPQTKENIEQKLLGMENRTYLWLHLAFEGIRRTFRYSLRPAQESIETLPSSVEDAYERILRRVPDKERSTVGTILQIVVGARRPLTVKEMSVALGVATAQQPAHLNSVDICTHRVEQNICDWCGLFVFINHAKIYLIHQTAKEFLVSNLEAVNPTSSWKHCFSTTDTEALLGCICVDFLWVKDISWYETSVRLSSHGHDVGVRDGIAGFLEYSAKYGPAHFANVQRPVELTVLDRMFRLHDTSSDVFPYWFRVYCEDLEPEGPSGLPPYLQALELAAFFGHKEVLSWLLLRQGQTSTSAGTAGAEALGCACTHDRAEVVRMLLDHGVDANTNYPWGVPLEIAAEWGHDEVVQTLLDYGASPNMPLKGFYGSALIAAIWRSHRTTVEILLNCGASINAQTTGKYGTALMAGIAAVADDKESFVQLLLDRGADINAEVSDGSHGTALIAACVHGLAETVQLLLDYGADLNAKATSGECGTALIAACELDQITIAQRLLAHGADISSQAQVGDLGTALIAAATKEDTVHLRLLLDSGADVATQARKGFYGTALIAACYTGTVKAVQLLLDRRADVHMHAATGDYGTALVAACS